MAAEHEADAERTRRTSKQTSLRHAFPVVQPQINREALQTQRREAESHAATYANKKFKSGVLGARRPRKWPVSGYSMQLHTLVDEVQARHHRY